MIGGTSHPLGRDGSENVGGWLQPGWYVLTFHGIGTINDGWFPRIRLQNMAALVSCGGEAKSASVEKWHSDCRLWSEHRLFNV
jgi:hypothetical protein